MSMVNQDVSENDDIKRTKGIGKERKKERKTERKKERKRKKVSN